MSNRCNIETFLAGDTIQAYYIVGMDGTTAQTVHYPNTTTNQPIGVAYKYADSGSSVAVQTGGIAKVIFNDTVNQ